MVAEAGVDTGSGHGGVGGDHSWSPPPLLPGPGVACNSPDTFSCVADGAVLVCRDGSGGAEWVARASCEPAETCVDRFGCAMLPSPAEGMIACVGSAAFEFDEARWQMLGQCPAEAPCVQGLGCPQALAGWIQCDPGSRPRCDDNGRLRICGETDDGWRWSASRACPDRSECVDQNGCAAPGGCRVLGRAICVTDTSTRHCDLTPSGVLQWSESQSCASGCQPGVGCFGCRRMSRQGCLD